MTLYRKYRPQTFEEVVGQEHVIETLRRAVAADRVAHAYLFSGARGVGKTTVARLLAKAVNCFDKKEKPCGKCKNCLAIATGSFVDLIEIDAASNRGIDEVRELRDKIRFAPSVGNKKVYIIDEVHMLTREAFNALLKTLEEPPAHSIFIFATTEPHKVPETVLSRCQRFDFHLAGKDLIERNIKGIAKSEKLNLAEDVLELLARASGGSYRDAQTMLGQLQPHLDGGKLTYELALSVLQISNQKQIDDFVQVLREGDANRAIGQIAKLKNKGIDFESFLDELIFQVRETLIELVEAGEVGDWERAVLKRLLEAKKEAKITPVASLPLELATIDLCGNQMQNVNFKSQNESPKLKNEKTGDIGKQGTVRDVREEKRVEFSADQKVAIIGAVAQKNKPLSVLLSSAEWKASGEAIQLAVEYSLYKDKIMSKNNLAMLEGEIEKVMGKKIPLRCEVAPKVKKDISEDIGAVFELES